MTDQRDNIITFDRLLGDLRALGIVVSTHVLTHSSLSSVGYVEGGAETVVRALVAAVSPDGTALFPAHTGHAAISPEHPPVFDVRSSPTLGIGAIPEAARTMPGAIRSLQPTHSVTAIGRLSQWFVDGHEHSETPCGPGSPYHKLLEVGGKILLLGCDHRSNTSIHMVEELIRADYHLLPGRGMMRITDADGAVHELPGRFHRWGIPRDFMRGDAEMTQLGIQRIGQIGAATARLVDARLMTEFLVEMLERDPLFLLPEGYSPYMAL
jgi:aminoglycoside 3-N-acetyltransferase